MAAQHTVHRQHQLANILAAHSGTTAVAAAVAVVFDFGVDCLNCNEAWVPSWPGCHLTLFRVKHIVAGGSVCLAVYGLLQHGSISFLVYSLC